MSKTYNSYRIKTIFQNSPKVYFVERRYNNFFALDEELRKNYQGCIIPLLPPKSYSYSISYFWSTNEDFIN